MGTAEREATNWLTLRLCPVLSNQPLTLNMATFFPYLLANLPALFLALRTCLPSQTVDLIPLLKTAL
jgi:hypothetical protein